MNKPSFSTSVSWHQPCKVLGLFSAGEKLDVVHGNFLPFHPGGYFFFQCECKKLKLLPCDVRWQCLYCLACGWALNS